MPLRQKVLEIFFYTTNDCFVMLCTKINTRVNCMKQSNRSITINKPNDDFLGSINI